MKIFSNLFLLFLILFYSNSSMANDELVFGSVAMDIPAVMHKRLKPLTKYLSKRLNKKVVLKGSISANCSASANESSDKPNKPRRIRYLIAHKRS